MYVEQIMTMLGLSDLQLALAVIGLLILIAVAVLNIKYSRARRKAKEQSGYALDDRFAREPSFTQGFADGDGNFFRFTQTITNVTFCISHNH